MADATLHPLTSYTCHLFPDEDKPVDSFIVGLSACLASAAGVHACVACITDMHAVPSPSLHRATVSIAIAIPVAVFLQGCFGIANDSEAPESWLEWCATELARASLCIVNA